MNVDENFENNLKKLKGKKENLHDLRIKSSHILAAICPRPMNRVPNLSLGSGLSPGMSHLQII